MYRMGWIAAGKRKGRGMLLLSFFALCFFTPRNRKRKRNSMLGKRNSSCRKVTAGKKKTAQEVLPSAGSIIIVSVACLGCG